MVSKKSINLISLNRTNTTTTRKLKEIDISIKKQKPCPNKSTSSLWLPASNTDGDNPSTIWVLTTAWNKLLTRSYSWLWKGSNQLRSDSNMISPINMQPHHSMSNRVFETRRLLIKQNHVSEQKCICMWLSINIK